MANQGTNYSVTRASKLQILFVEDAVRNLDLKKEKAEETHIITLPVPKKPMTIADEISEMIGDFNDYYSPDDFYSCGMYIK